MTHSTTHQPCAPAIMFKTAALLIALTLTHAAGAHEGHGLPGASHWHGTDALGYLAAALVIGALWASWRK